MKLLLDTLVAGKLIRANEPLTILDDTTDGFLVELEDGSQGYVRGDRITSHGCNEPERTEK